jgi:hypothetical protein
MTSQPISRWGVHARLAFYALTLGSSLLTPAVAEEAPAPSGPTSGAAYVEQGPAPQPSFVADAKAYVTAPLHWNGHDWLYFGSSLAAIAVAHHYDDQVRTHFTTGSYASNLTNSNSSEGKDALPAVAVVGATWLYAGLVNDSAGHREAASMVESAVLSCATGFVLRLAVGRERPNETADANQWRAGSNSFPSLHATAAFAIGTVLAESGNDDYRWIRRVLGYGLGAVTSYERLRHNAHWLSDTVAGAALGMSTAHFVMNRRGPQATYAGNLSVTPIAGGAMLTFSINPFP